MKRRLYFLAGAILGGAVIAFLLYWKFADHYTAQHEAVAEVADAKNLPSQSASTLTPAPDIKYPVADSSSTSASGIAPSAESLIAELVGNAMFSLFQMDEFAHRFVATVDNLGRPYAPASVWPLNPVGGRFFIEKIGDRSFIGKNNSTRYSPYLTLAESTDMQAAVVVYRQLYPQLQKAYRQLGYPRGYFNDRLVEVIDELLATPELEVPIAVFLPKVEGAMKPPRPWVMYEFEEPALQDLTSGQKILVRLGVGEERRVKEKLIEIRKLITSQK